MASRKIKRSPRVKKSNARSRKITRSRNIRSPKVTKGTSKGSAKAAPKGSRGMKLISITRSPKSDKKFVATFSRGGRTKQVHFGAKGYSDLTIHKNEDRKGRYIARHKSRENWNKPDTAGALSRWVLWNKPSLKASISDYKRRFGL